MKTEPMIPVQEELATIRSMILMGILAMVLLLIRRILNSRPGTSAFFLTNEHNIRQRESLPWHLLASQCVTGNSSARDHITPISKGGGDIWQNVVAACRRCNNHKGGATPDGAGMQLIAVPFVPTYAEYIYLKGRRVLADQMEFLIAHFPRKSPLHDRLKETFGLHT